MPARPAALLLALVTVATVASFAPAASADPFLCVSTEKRTILDRDVRPMSFCVLSPEARH
jgi:hypothetical protein